jgi:hypothetical protein
MRPSSTLCCTLSFAMLAVATRAAAAEYQVAQGGSCSDDGPGTAEQPWCTVQKAADTMVAGDTVLVRAGVYRESVTPANAGEADKPIHYKAAPGEKVVLTGADTVSGWKACTATDCPSVRDPSKVYYADLDYLPPLVFENGARLERARMPFDDYWVAEGGGMTTLVDSQHLCADCLPGIPQTEGWWVGATLVFWKHDMGIHSFRTVTAFDLAQHMLTLDDVIYSDWVVEGGVDTWTFENHVSLIERAGQWVIADGAQGKRLYLQPAAGSDPNGLLIEASHRDRFIIEYGTKSHLIFEGFELTQSAGHGIGNWNSPYPQDIRILGNRIHDNASTGVYLREATGCLVQDNEIWANEIGLSGGPGSVVDHNKIHHNSIDGLWPGDHALISRNVIAHQNNLNHPDNIQTCCGASEGIVFDGNLILNGGQCFMLEQTSKSVVRNNVILGSGAYCLIFGDDTVNDWEVAGNTFGLTGYGAVRMEGTGYTLRDNIFFTAGTSSAFAAPETGLLSDYNLLFAPSTNERGVVNYKGETYGTSVTRPFSEYQKLSGQDSHSAEADPLFLNYPACMAQDGTSTTDTVTTMDNEDCFAQGDHIEIDFDGVVRTVESKSVDEATHGAILKFTPALERRIWHGFLVLNWKAGTNTEIDVTPGASSPACHMSSTGSYVGAIACQGSSGGGVKPWEDGGMPDGSLPSFGSPPGGESSGCGCRAARGSRGSWLAPAIGTAAALLAAAQRR